ncbi:MAG: hypothetical protein KKD05_08105 [Candidatus Omnitrophica bacterium]|nr:hypothetical protein [Candidatus Omnitrophota bacterium]
MILETGLRFAAWIAQRNLKQESFSKNGKLKILCLGDSYTYGLGVERDQAYPAQLESLLKEKLGKDKVEVINAGRPGMNTPMLANRFDAFMDNYQPNIVLVLIGTNDEWNFSGFISEPTTIMDKLYLFICSLRTARMFKIVKTAFKENPEMSFLEIKANKDNISKMLSLIEENGGLNNSYYYQAVMMGNQYRDMYKFEEAKLYYDCALKINPDDGLISKELLRYHKKALTVLRDELKKYNINKILKEVDQLGGFDKAYYYDLIKMGNESRDNNRFEEAKLYYDSALKIQPNGQRITQELMVYNKKLAKRENLESKKDPLEKSKANISEYIRSVYLNKEQLEHDNKFMLEMIDLSKICRTISLFEDNLLLLTKTIYLYGFSAEVWEELDELFIAWPFPENAIEFYQALSVKYPNNIDIYLRLARQYKIVQDYKQVIASFEKVLELNPNNQQAVDGIIMANEFIDMGLTKDYVFPNNNAGLFAQINTALDRDKGEILADDPGNNVVEAPEIALGIYVREKRYDQQVEDILSQDKDYAALFGKNPANYEAFVAQRLAKISSIVSQRIKQMCASAKQRKLKILFLSYPLSFYPRVAKTVEAESIPFIDFRESFFSIITPDNYKDYFLADGHCTPKGYKIVADKVAEIILPGILNQSLVSAQGLNN